MLLKDAKLCLRRAGRRWLTRIRRPNPCHQSSSSVLQRVAVWTHVWELAGKKWTVSQLCIFWEPRHHHQTVTRGSHTGWLPVRHALGKRRTPRVPEHQVANLDNKCGHEVWTASTGVPGAQCDGQEPWHCDPPKSQATGP